MTVQMSSSTMRAHLHTIRVRKEDSAFVYFVLESHEGITAYSTLDFKAEDPYRDLQLMIPPDFIGEVRDLLAELALELEGNLYEFGDDGSIRSLRREGDHPS